MCFFHWAYVCLIIWLWSQSMRKYLTLAEQWWWFCYPWSFFEKKKNLKHHWNGNIHALFHESCVVDDFWQIQVLYFGVDQFNLIRFAQIFLFHLNKLSTKKKRERDVFMGRNGTLEIHFIKWKTLMRCHCARWLVYYRYQMFLLFADHNDLEHSTHTHTHKQN